MPPHWWGIGLQLSEFGRILRRQCVRDGGQELRHLHQRALQPAQYGAQILGMRGPVGLDAEHALTRHARRYAAHCSRSPRHPAQFAKQIAAIRHGGG